MAIHGTLCARDLGVRNTNRAVSDGYMPDDAEHLSAVAAFPSFLCFRQLREFLGFRIVVAAFRACDIVAVLGIKRFRTRRARTIRTIGLLGFGQVHR